MCASICAALGYVLLLYSQLCINMWLHLEYAIYICNLQFLFLFLVSIGSDASASLHPFALFSFVFGEELVHISHGIKEFEMAQRLEGPSRSAEDGRTGGHGRVTCSWCSAKGAERQRLDCLGNWWQVKGWDCIPQQDWNLATGLISFSAGSTEHAILSQDCFAAERHREGTANRCSCGTRMQIIFLCMSWERMRSCSGKAATNWSRIVTLSRERNKTQHLHKLQGTRGGIVGHIHDRLTAFR